MVPVQGAWKINEVNNLIEIKETKMGNIRSMLTKPLRTFNIERRAEEVISRDKPIPAPTFPSVKKQLKMAQKVSPDFLEKHAQKNTVLDERLKQVYVSSSDTVPEQETSNKPLPTDRSQHKPFEYGIYEPQEIAAGKCTLRQALTFIQQHHMEPERWSLEKIAQEYHLDQQVVENIVKYFGILNRRDPELPKGDRGSLLFPEPIKISFPVLPTKTVKK